MESRSCDAGFRGADRAAAMHLLSLRARPKLIQTRRLPFRLNRVPRADQEGPNMNFSPRRRRRNPNLGSNVIQLSEFGLPAVMTRQCREPGAQAYPCGGDEPALASSSSGL
ncbi:hypothetical protein DM02DRAFT_653417 [Periconia macrospinosa]|uniref:Uncharacterized protein n=1 Tax=Periconia macrospinosa TaxID=97972 RepID=A0A2V1DW80_9PLEO|nr:hypothetical protein DM02DRAFT_653417 [Periconia macrospinosa]